MAGGAGAPSHAAGAARIYASDNHDLFPGAIWVSNLVSYIPSAAEYFTKLSNEISTPNIFVCPKDVEMSKRAVANSFTNLSNANISYFISLSASQGTNPQAFFAGDRNLIVNNTPANPGLLIMRTNDWIAWTGEMHNEQGNIVMVDGSVQQLSSRRVNSEVRQGNLTNFLLIP